MEKEYFLRDVLKAVDVSVSVGLYLVNTHHHHAARKFYQESTTLLEFIEESLHQKNEPRKELDQVRLSPFFPLASNAFSDIGSVGRIEKLKKSLKKKKHKKSLNKRPGASASFEKVTFLD